MAMGNNPIVNIDPDGEFFLGTLLTGIFDFVGTLFFKGALDPTSKKARQGAWEQYDPSAPWSKTNKAWKIDIGAFKTDENKGPFGRAWELVSRWTWQLPQTLVGKTASHGANNLGWVNEVNYFHGATVLSTSLGSGGMTLGSYILGYNMTPDFKNHTFVHEYGHYLQSQKWGPLYVPLIAIPSAESAFIDNDGSLFDIGDHHDRWFEAGASRLGANYFDKYYTADGFDIEYFYKGWNLNRPAPYFNPITGSINQPHPQWGHFHWSDPALYLYLGIPFLFF